MGAYSINWRFGIILSDYKGQSCIAGYRISVQEGIYDDFLGKFTATAAHLASKTGDPFDPGAEHGPQASKVQFDVCPFSMDCAFVELLLSARDEVTLTPGKKQAPPSTKVASFVGTLSNPPYSPMFIPIWSQGRNIRSCGCYRQVQRSSWSLGDG